MMITRCGNEANTEKESGGSIFMLLVFGKNNRENQFGFIFTARLTKVLPPPCLIFPTSPWPQNFGPNCFAGQTLFPKEKPHAFFPAHYSPCFSPIPTVLTIHDLAFFLPPKEFKPVILAINAGRLIR